jgi:hypothetical protein
LPVRRPDAPDLDIAVIDQPGFLSSVEIAAAGESGHGPMKAPRDATGKICQCIGVCIGARLLGVVGDLIPWKQRDYFMHFVVKACLLSHAGEWHAKQQGVAPGRLCRCFNNALNAYEHRDNGERAIGGNSISQAVRGGETFHSAFRGRQLVHGR